MYMPHVLLNKGIYLFLISNISILAPTMSTALFNSWKHIKIATNFMFVWMFNPKLEKGCQKFWKFKALKSAFFVQKVYDNNFLV